MDRETGIQNEIVEGRNAVTEALRAGRPIDKSRMSPALLRAYPVAPHA